MTFWPGLRRSLPWPMVDGSGLSVLPGRAIHRHLPGANAGNPGRK